MLSTAPPGTNDVTFSVDMNSYPYSFYHLCEWYQCWRVIVTLADADGDGVWATHTNFGLNRI